MTRPSNLVYSVEEVPPKLVCLISAFQHVAILAPHLILAILVVRAAGGTVEDVTGIVSLSLVTFGVGTILQSLTHRWIGSGYLISYVFTNAYYPVTVAAIKLGGMPLVFGMTLFGGALEMLFAPLLRRFRPFFPTEISGICVLLIGVIVGLLGLRQLLGIDDIAEHGGASSGPEVALGVGTLAVMVGLNVWSKGSLRMYCAIIGILVGVAVGAGMGEVEDAAFSGALSAGIVAFPKWSARLPHFRLDLVIPFTITALACCLRAMGDITNAQRINGRDWVRPEMTSIRNGLFADGLSTMVSAFLGSVGGNTYSASVGLSSATGVTSRQIALWTGGILIALSLFPIAAAAVVSVPRPVVGAALLFNSSFILINGIQIITSRLLDARKTFTVGLALVLSLSRDVFPDFYRTVPDIFQSFVASGFVMGVTAALLLNAIFRIGVRSTVSLTLSSGADAHGAIRGFLDQQGARWGARRDVMERVIFGTAQAVESIAEHCNSQGPIDVTASFDEFNLDIVISYHGDAFTIEDRRPTDAEIRESEDGIRRLAGFMLQQNADRVRITSRDGRAALEFHYQH
jgi:NCS2 family nucleobase:cation symporter-2